MSGDHREIVADEQDRQAALGAERGEQIEDFRLHGDVERRRRLVGDQQLGAAGERHGDHHPLPLAARQRERIGAGEPIGIAQPHPLQQSNRLRAGPRARPAAMQPQRFGDLIADAMQRVERRHRLLEHHGDAVAAQRLHLGFAGAGDVAALEANRAADLRALGQKTHDGERRNRLAGAGLADDAERLALLQRERDAAHDPFQPAGAGQVDAEVFDFEQHQRRARSFGSSASRRPSPSRLRPSTENATASPGNTASRGAT